MIETTGIMRGTGRRRGLTSFALFCITTLILSALYVRLQFNPPEAFTGTQSLEVSPGISVRDIAQEAANAGIVRSGTLLYVLLTYSHDPTQIFAGTYVFSEPASVFAVAQKLADQDIENELVTITIPEGVRLTQIAQTAEVALPDFDVDDYLINTLGLEGYLFPETYFVPETFLAQDLIDLQRATYEENMMPLREQIELSPLSEYEALILASIIEREANDEESMKMVSGILQNRLKIGMALQADASIEYTIGTPLNELPPGQLASELRETESPYNTYLNTGLTPTPIGNPGLMAIKAALNPTPSDNFFYITGNDGEFYYAETLKGHNQNIARYLR